MSKKETMILQLLVNYVAVRTVNRELLDNYKTYILFFEGSKILTVFLPACFAKYKA